MDNQEEEKNETQLDRMERLLVNMDLRLKRVEEELMIRRRKAVKRVQRGRDKAGGSLPIPKDSMGRDTRMPYDYWGKVLVRFGQNQYSASDYCRWLINDWIAQFALQNRKKVLSITSGRIRYFAEGTQQSAAEVDVFGRRGMCTTTPKRKAEVGEVMWWDWTQAHIMMIRRNLEDEPEWELLPKAFKQRIDFLWAPYSEVSIAQVKDYDPRNPKHQVSLVGLYMHELFTGGFRRGLQNQREHKAWCQQRKIDELIRDLK